MALISSLGGYLIVRLVDEDGDTVRDIVVPDFWYHEGFCRIPSTGLESKAENKEMFKSSWPSFEVKLLSIHKTYAAARDRNLAGALESESALTHMANLKKPRQRVPVMREESPAEPSADRRPNDGVRKRQPTRQPTLLAPPTPTPPPKLLKRSAEIRPYVQEVDFDDELSDDGFTPLPFSEAETQQVLLKLNSTSDEEDSFDFGDLEEEESVAQPPASPATIRRFIDLNRNHGSSVAAPSKSAEHSAGSSGSTGNSTGSLTAGQSGSTGNSTDSSSAGFSGSMGHSAGPSSYKVPVSQAAGSSGSLATGPSGSLATGAPGSLATGPSGSLATGPSGSQTAGPSGSQTAGPSGSQIAGPSGSQTAGPSGSPASTSPGANPSAGSSGSFMGAGSSLRTKGFNLSKSKAAKVFAESTPRCPISNCSDGHKQTHNYQRAMGRLVISFSNEMNMRFERMEKRISSSSIANPEIHPSFQAARYNMPLPDPEAFFDFEKKLKNDPSVRQNLVAAIRGFGGKDYKSAMKIAWKECASDQLLSLGTWTGQIKAGTNKDKALKFMDSELEKTINNAVKFGPVFGDVTIDKLQEVSSKWVLKAKERLGKPAASSNAADNATKK